jgi:hypothetical protein
MSQLSNGISKRVSTGILGAIAVALTFGAVQFASGRDLAKQDIKQASWQDSTSAATINREAKADRAGRPAGPVMPTNTISFRLNDLSDTSVLVRMPVAPEASKGAAAPVLTKSGLTKSGRTTLACEPVVSVLTEVAKHLQPGRCVT